MSRAKKEDKKKGTRSALGMRQAIQEESKKERAEEELPVKRQIAENKAKRLSKEDDSGFKENESRMREAAKDIRVVTAQVLPPEEGFEEKQPKKKGGAREGAGRKKRSEKLSNYAKANKLLDASIIPALQVLIDGLDHSDKYYRFKCSELLLKKSIPDKKSQEIKAMVDSPYSDIGPKEVEEAVMQVEALIHEKISKMPVPKKKLK